MSSDHSGDFPGAATPSPRPDDVFGAAVGQPAAPPPPGSPRSAFPGTAPPPSPATSEYSANVATPLVQIGDISVFHDRVVTPSGSAPVSGLSWTFRDSTLVTETISTAGIVLAVLFFWVCFLGLLFLLIKDKKIQGNVEVTISADGFSHFTQIPISNTDQVAYLRSAVDYARGLSLR